MIRYGDLTRSALETLVDAHDAAWRTEVTNRTDAIVKAGAFLEKTSIWGDVKLVFMELQHYKCIFCERALARKLAGRVEHDVEHFRPKSSIKAWPKAGRKNTPPKYPFPTGTKSDSGYYWLAYDLENYAAACKPCNTARKSNYFPIHGTRGKATDSVRELNAVEQPLLIYPLSDVDDDPEDLITFEGILAKPRHAAGVENSRAQVTIDFLALNEREELWEDRFRVIQTLFWAMKSVATGSDDEMKAAQQTVDDAISDAGPQASCARNFLALMTSDAASAWAIFQTARAFLETKRKPKK